MPPFYPLPRGEAGRPGRAGGIPPLSLVVWHEFRDETGYFRDIRPKWENVIRKGGAGRYPVRAGLRFVREDRPAVGREGL
jgi:hypothetical protein